MLKFGVVGLGFGSNYAKTIHSIEGAELSAICVRSQETLDTKLKEFKDEFGALPKGYLSLGEMLEKEELDGVIVSTPSSTHHKLAVQVADAGVALLIDKPVDINTENIQVIQDAVYKNNIPCGVIYPNRCLAAYRGVKKVVAEELLGKALFCEIRLKYFREQDYYEKGAWRGTWAMDGGGSLMNQGIHPIDLLCYIFGKPKSVIGSMAILNHAIETEDWASAIIEFENNMHVTFSTSTCVSPQLDKHFMDFHAQKGSISIVSGDIKESSLEKLNELDPYDFKDPIEDFVDALKNKRDPMVSISEASRSVELVNYIYESARQGRKLEL